METRTREDDDPSSTSAPPIACHYCGCARPKYRCCGCSVAYYCDEEHQKKHWVAHRAFCRCEKRDAHDDSVSANREPVRVGLPTVSKIVEMRRAAAAARGKEARSGRQVIARGMLDRSAREFADISAGARESLRTMRNGRRAEEISAEYYSTLGKSAYEIDVKMRAHLRELLEAMGTREDRILSVFSAWAAESAASKSILGATMYDDVDDIWEGAKAHDRSAEVETYLRNGEIARKILAEEVLRWTSESISSGVVPREAGREVARHLAGDDPNAPPEARAEHEKFAFASLGRELSLAETATFGGRSFLAAGQGADDAAGPATRKRTDVPRFVDAEKFDGDDDDDVPFVKAKFGESKLSEAESDAGPLGSADADWSPENASESDEARDAREQTPDEMMTSESSSSESEAAKRERRMREALSTLAEAERIYETKAMLGDADAKVAAAEVRETTKRIVTSPSQFLDSRKVLTFAAATLGIAVLFGVGALAYESDFAGIRGMAKQIEDRFAELKATLDGAEERLSAATAEVARNREEVADVMESTVDVGRNLQRMKELSEDQAAVASNLAALTAELNVKTCTADQIADDANACATAALETIGGVHAKLAETASTFASASADIARRCAIALDAFRRTGSVDRADAEWLAKNLMSDEVRTVVESISKESERLGSLSSAIGSEILAAGQNLDDVARNLTNVDVGLEGVVRDLRAGLSGMKDADVALKAAEDAAKAYVASAGDVTCVRAFVETVKRLMPGHNNLAEYLGMKLGVLDEAERVARNSKRDLEYVARTGGAKGALSALSTVVFGVACLNDASRSASSFGSVASMVGTVLRWPGAALWKWGQKMMDYFRVASVREEEVEEALRIASAIRSGEKVTDLDYETMKRSHWRTSAYLGRASPAKRASALLGGSMLLGASAVLRGCATVAEVVAAPMRAAAHVGNLSVAFVNIGSRFSESIRLTSAAIAAGGGSSIATGLESTITFIGSPTTTLREMVMFLKDVAWPVATTAYEFVASHLWGATTGVGVLLVGMLATYYMSRGARIGPRAMAAYRSYRYTKFGLGTAWKVATTLSSSYSLVKLGMLAGRTAGPIVGGVLVALCVAQGGWAIYKKWKAMRESTLDRKSVGDPKNGDDDEEDEFMPTVEDEPSALGLRMYGLDESGRPVDSFDVAGLAIETRKATRERLSDAARHYEAHVAIFASEEMLRWIIDELVAPADEEAVIMRDVRTWSFGLCKSTRC